MLSLGTEYDTPPSYKEWKNTFVNNVTIKWENTLNDIKNNSLKKEDKIKLLKKLIDISDSKIKIIENQ